jgi:cell division septation protein DedD
VVTEEPELLADHLRGESESISLDDIPLDRAPLGTAEASVSPPADLGGAAPIPVDVAGAREEAARLDRESGMKVEGLPAVAAAPELTSAAQTPSPDSSPAAMGSPVARAAASPKGVSRAPTAAASRGTGKSWSIQVGAFSEEAAAEKLANGLRDRFPVAVLPAGDNGGRWRVRVQPILGEDRARELAERLKQDHRLPTWVTPMEGRSGS